MLEELKEYFAKTPREKILSDWDKTKKCDNVGITVSHYLEILKTKYKLKYKLSK